MPNSRLATIESVRIGTDEIQAVRGADGEGYVVLRRMCEVLGVQPHGQVEKLKIAPWAVTQMICATAADGKNYKCFCLHVNSVPMWLATIDASRVAVAVRPKLVTFQCEAADALSDWALDQGVERLEPAEDLNDPAQLAAIALKSAQLVVGLTKIVQGQHTELEEVRPQAAGYRQLISSEGLRGLQQTAKALSEKPNNFIKDVLVGTSILFHREGVLVPYQKYIDCGYFVVRSRSVSGKVRTQTFVTQSGFNFLFMRFGTKQPELFPEP